MSAPKLADMFERLLRAKGQSRAARTVEYFGFVDFTLGLLLLLDPWLSVSLLRIPPLTTQGENYLRLVGLLVSGLGMLYIVSGRLNAQGFVFASLLDRPMVPAVMAVLWYKDILPGPLALAFAISDFSGFLWTLFAWRADERLGPYDSPQLIAKIVAGLFGFVSGVVRNARTFHPDGRVMRGTVRSLHPPDAHLAQAGELLAGAVLLRMGRGLMKRGAPLWLAERIPDAPSIACRFFNPETTNEDALRRRPGEDLDLLCTAGGDRLWKLVLNLATGGKMYGLQRFDYFKNVYYSQVPYRVGDAPFDLWIRLVPGAAPGETSPANDGGREQQLTNAIADHAVVRIEAQRAGDRRAAWIAFAELRFEEEIQIDQEALHFDPVEGRRFVPTGFLTDLREAVYPSSRMYRPPTELERARRDREGVGARFEAYFEHRLSRTSRLAMTADGQAGVRRPRRWLKIFSLSAVILALLLTAYLVVRFTRDRPVEYSDDVLHFLYGSTGGERRNGIPYWFWVALPELFPEYLPDKKPGHGYSSFGMIYEKGKDPRYDLPVGTSMRNYRGIDVVYLNCASCHTGTVRDAAGSDPHVVPGMPANTFDLGAWGRFLTDVPLDQKFSGQRLLDQIAKMEDDPHRRAPKPDFINRLIFRYVAADLMRDQLLILRQRLAFIDKNSWGPGRVDTFNAPKALLNFPMQHADPKELMGNADFPSIWNQGPRKGMQLHWDGNNTSVDERNLSAAYGTGAYPPNLDVQRVLRTAKWLETAQPLPYPYPIDAPLAWKGAEIYKEYCAGCHGTREAPFRHSPPQEGEHVGTVVPIANIGTDRSRLDSYTRALAVNQSTLYAGYEEDWGFDQPYPQRFSHFRKTQGYANAPLDGIWLRAPYLHNGSVPNLRELLEPSLARTKCFYRGNDVYDPGNVGFVYDVAERDGQRFFPFDTTKTGNHNFGHEGPAYGTSLSPERKRALLEYLKTF
jgi:mono/diheme cytochrome c family protein